MNKRLEILAECINETARINRRPWWKRALGLFIPRFSRYYWRGLVVADATFIMDGRLKGLATDDDLVTKGTFNVTDDNDSKVGYR